MNLYTENEKTVLECELYVYNNELLENIVSLLKIEQIDRLIVNCNQNEYIKNWVKEISKRFSLKEIYSPFIFSDIRNTYSRIELKINDFDNISIGEIENYKIVNLVIDIDENISNESLKRIGQISRAVNYLFIEFDCSSKIILNKYLKQLNKIKSVCKNIYLSALFKDSEFVSKHPCNIYLCSGKTCHSKKGNIPRYLYVNMDGVYPYKVVDEKYNIDKEISAIYKENFEDYMLNDYGNSAQHKNFISGNRYAFHNYIIKDIAKVYPWNLVLKEAICDE